MATTQAQPHPLPPSASDNMTPAVVHLNRAVLQNPNDMRELHEANPRFAHTILQGQLMLGKVRQPSMTQLPASMFLRTSQILTQKCHLAALRPRWQDRRKNQRPSAFCPSQANSHSWL